MLDINNANALRLVVAGSMRVSLKIALVATLFILEIDAFQVFVWILNVEAQKCFP